jgi:hypothetical protein
MTALQNLHPEKDGVISRPARLPGGLHRKASLKGCVSLMMESYVSVMVKPAITG